MNDRAAFIRAETRLQPVPHVPDIQLHLADEAIPLWQKTEEELEALGLPPPFWAFAWAGGQALARYILDHPETVAERRVLDFASGSGLCAISALKAGAAACDAADIDPFAAAAIPINGAANGVAPRVIAGNVLGEDRGWDVVLAGDIFYEQDLGRAVFAWLSALAARGAKILIGDPGRAYLPRTELSCLATYEVPVTRALEDSEIKKTSVWTIGEGIFK